MLFNSLEFLIFFIFIVFIYFLISPKYRWVLLLLGSYYFYMCWKPEYILLIVSSTLIDYYAGIKMAQEKNKANRKPFLLLSLFTNLGLLFAFKYFNFFSESTRALFDYINIFYNMPHFNVLLPVGISFYTFQTLSYSIDVYRGEKTAEKHLGIFALYVAFFPQLVAGPIERSTRLLPQLRKENTFDFVRVKEGLLLMLWGFFKKIVIADRLAVVVNTVYNDVGNYQGFELIIASIFFAFQIYCDFSGYSDIAIGGAKVMGYDLMKNFNRPYFSKSIVEFWRRWHISLGSWFRDYVYFPLGGSRVSMIKKYSNLLIVFLVSGLWHGANWTFVIWGALHGSYQIIGYILTPIRNKIKNLLQINSNGKYYKLFQVIFTFILVDFAWIFFRANSLNDALYIIKNLFVFNLNSLTDKSMLNLGLHEKDIYLSFLLIILLLIVQLKQRNTTIIKWILRQNLAIRWAIYLLSIYSIIIFGHYASGKESQFIYFQF